MIETDKQQRQILRYFLGNPLTAFGSGVILLLVLIALFAPFLATHDPNAINIAERLRAPGVNHFFGTDDVGRDLFSRVLFGTRISLTMGLSAVALVFVFGCLIGGMSALLGGRVDVIIMRFMDIMLSVPGLVLAMSLAAALGPSLFNVLLALCIVRTPHYVRLMRGQALSIRNLGYVEMARVNGAGYWHILRYHIIPNGVPPVLIQATSDIGGVILAVSTLSFIGLGAQPPTAEWGAMISAGRQYILSHWWYATFPGLAILVTVMGFNLLGDGLRDLYDPKSSRRSA